MSTGTYFDTLEKLEKIILSSSYFILPSVIPAEHVAMMTGVIDRAIAKRDKDIATTKMSEDAIANDDGLLLCSADGKYFFFLHEDREPEMNQVIFSTYMEQIVRGMQ